MTKAATLDEAKVDAIFASVNQCTLPGAAVAIAIDGAPVYRKGFGLANIELPVVLNPAMRMRIGSTTKHFTALAYMLLCEEGRASLDDPIGEYVPGLHATNHNATVRQLLTHTSGLRDAFDISLQIHNIGRPITDPEMIAYYQTIDDLNFPPGESWNYNNGGYILTSVAIERITGETLDDVFRKRILDPIGMHDTMLRRWDSGFASNSATLHMKNHKGEWARDVMGMEISGAGGMVSTMDDMLRWLKHMDAPIVGSAETWRTMRTPQSLRNGSPVVYGLGLIMSRYRGVDTIQHAGGVVGGNSQMIKIPAAKLDISIAVNRDDVAAADLAYQIIDACVEGLDEPYAPAKTERSGAFVSQKTGRVIELSVANGAQLMAVSGGAPMPVMQDEAGALRLPRIASQLLHSVQIDGAALHLSDFGERDTLTEITPEPDAKIGARMGRYESPAIFATADITETADGARMTLSGKHGSAGYTLEPITATIWRAKLISPWALPMSILTFTPGGFTLSSGRTIGVRFTRA